MPKTDGCLAASSSVTFDGVGGSFTYTYDVNTGNTNARTIQGFSTGANSRFRPGDGEPFFDDFQKFVTYYGDIQYADEWVTAAIEKRDTTGFTNGQADFSKYGDDGRVRKFLQLNSFFSYA